MKDLKVVMNMEITITQSALEEMLQLAAMKFDFALTEATDGIPMYVAKKDGLVRQFSVIRENTDRIGDMLAEKRHNA